MAVWKHEEKLREGVAAWNKWREDNPDIKPDLVGIDINSTVFRVEPIFYAGSSRAELADINFSHTDLRSTRFIDANLIGANFDNAQLLRAVLDEADLADATFRDAKLQHASLKGCNLFHAKFFDANLGSACLTNTMAQETYFTKANLFHTDFSNSYLENGKFEGARGSFCKFNESQMDEASLSGGKFRHSQFQGTVLINANTSDATLFHGDFTGAVLRGVDLSGSDLRFARFSQSEVDGIKWDRKTQCSGCTAESSVGSHGFKTFIFEQGKKEEFIASPLKEKILWPVKTIYDCGLPLGVWAIWALIIAVAFAFVFTECPSWFPDWWHELCAEYGPRFQQTPDAYKPESFGLGSAFYFSIVTFTTLGFGDVVAANPMARFLVGVEVVLGYIMLGGLISILANKLARRA